MSPVISVLCGSICAVPVNPMPDDQDPQGDALLRRRRGWAAFLSEKGPVLQEFVDDLALPFAEVVLTDPWALLPGLDKWLAVQAVEGEDIPWTASRVGYWIGDAVVAKYAGEWYLNEQAGTRFHLHYVVGRFPQRGNAMISPMAVALEFLSEPPGRSLTQTMGQVCREIDLAGSQGSRAL
jgi:hypothetical protein